MKKLKKSIKCKINFKDLFLFLRKLFNGFIRSGKKDTSEKFFFKICFKIKTKFKDSIFIFFNTIMLNLVPIVGFKPKHLGRMRYNIPVSIKKKNQINLAVRWLKGSISERKELKFEERIFEELKDIYFKSANCSSLKKKKLHYVEVFSNKAFTKYLRTFKSKRR